MKKSWLFSLCITILLSGCHVVGLMDGTGIQKAPKVIPGEGEVHGMLVDPDGNPIKGLGVHFAKVFRTDGTLGYVVDSGNDPAAISDAEGQFTLEIIPAGEYVMWVGDLMTGYAVINNTDGSPTVWIINGNAILEMDQVQVDQPKK